MKKKKILPFVFQIGCLFIILGFIVAVLLLRGQNKNEQSQNLKTEDGVCQVKGKYYVSIQTAIDENMNNILIEILKDTSETIYISNRYLTIKGNDHTLNLPIKSQSEDHLGVINIVDSEIIIENLTIIGNKENKVIGTGVMAKDSTISFRNVTISNFGNDEMTLDENFGFGLHLINTKVQSVKISISDSQFNNLGYCAIYLENYAKKQGDINPTIKTEISDSLFLGINNSQLPQIAILLLGNIAGVINNCQFRDFNSIEYDSYGIYYHLSSNTLTLYENTFVNINKNIKESFSNQ